METSLSHQGDCNRQPPTEAGVDVTSEPAAPVHDGRFLPLVAACAAVTAVVGILALVGWVLELPSLKSLWQPVPMNPTTAVAFMLCGISLWMVRSPGRSRSKQLGRCLMLLVAFVGAVKLVELFAGIETGVDQLFFASQLNGNRIAPNTALCLMLVGAALFLIDVRTRRRRGPAAPLLLTVGAVALVAVAGYVYAIFGFYGVGGFTPMALNTAITFLALCTGGLCARPDAWPVASVLRTWTLRRTITTGYAAALVMLCLIGFVSFRTTRSLIAYSALSDRDLQTIIALEDLFGEIKDVETAARGFAITGERHYLEPYKRAMAEHGRTRERLIELLADAPEQAARLREMDTLIAAKMAFMTQVIAAREELGEAEALAVVRTGKGKALMDEIRLGMTELRAAKGASAAETSKQGKELSIRTLRTIVAAMLSSFGLVAGAGLLIRRGMAEQRRAEAGFRESEERFKQLAGAVDQVFWISSLDSRKIYYVSPAYERIWGRTAESLYADSTDFLHGVHPDDREHVIAALAAQGAEGFYEASYRVVRPNGVTRWLHARGFPVHDANGRVYRVAGVAEDVTERKRAEDALRESELRLRSVTDAASDVILSADGDGNILSWNSAGNTVFGYTAEEVIGRPISILMPAEYRAMHEQGLSRATSTGDARLAGRVLELRGLRKDGSEFPIDLSFGFWKAGGKMFYSGIIRDATERNAIQTEMRKAMEAAEAASRTKSDFLANMSHEIRTPMAAIIGHADLLLDPDGSQSDRLNSVNAIRRSGQHLLTVINDILDLSKIEAGKMTVERVDCDPCRVLGEVASLMRPRAQEKSLAFNVAFNTPLPRTIQSDPTRLRQVLINLVGNAIKFTEKGSVTVSIGLDELPSFGTMLRAEIADTGVGISPEQVNRLFTPFSQADASTTRRFGGTGLGLAISRRIAQLLGGDVLIESKPGWGSRFSVVIPAGDMAGREMVRDPAEAIRLSNAAGAGGNPSGPLRGRVLLAEDGPENQVVICAYLRKAGAEVTVANDGREAVDMVRTGAFDVVLMDMQMPHLDGYGAASKLRQEGFTLPIVALTAHAMSEDRDKCITAGCTDYLSKPVNRDDLLNTVRRHLSAAAPGALVGGAPALTGSAAPEGGPAAPRAGALRSQLADDPEISQCLPHFLAALPEKVAALASLRRATDLQILQDTLHQLKGSGGMYGFPQITEVAGEAERRVKEGKELEKVREAVEDLVRIVRSVEGYDPSREQPTCTTAPRGT